MARMEELGSGESMLVVVVEMVEKVMGMGCYMGEDGVGIVKG